MIPESVKEHLMHSILYIDDETALLDVCKLFLERTGEFTVDTHITAQAALDALAKTSFDCIVSDYQMPGMDGIQFLQTIRSRGDTTPFIIFTGKGREEVAIQALNSGADFYLQKGGEAKAQFVELAHMITQAIRRKSGEEALRKSEQRYRKSEERLAQIIDFLPDATFAIDRDGRVIAWNLAIQEMTGVPAQEIIGKGDREYAIALYGSKRPILIDQLFDPKENPEKNDYTILKRTNDLIIAETGMPGPTGEMRTLWVKVSPLYDDKRNKIGAIKSIRDITDRKATELALEVANKKLNLLTDITRHDIRNRLTVLTGYLEMFRSHPAEPYFSMYVNKINDIVNAMNAQIEVTRVYQELGIQNPVWQNVDTLFKRVLSQLDTRSVTVYSEPDGWEIYADPLLEKVFYNIIDHALKCGMTLTEIRRRSYEFPEGLVITIEDNGVGIPQENKERIFAKGFGKNTSLGLFFSREVLSITGITIRETGEPGRGARFTITVPKGEYRRSS
jgi:PAS domain S-box-containing protein